MKNSRRICTKLWNHHNLNLCHMWMCHVSCVVYHLSSVTWHRSNVTNANSHNHSHRPSCCLPPTLHYRLVWEDPKTQKSKCKKSIKLNFLFKFNLKKIYNWGFASDTLFDKISWDHRKGGGDGRDRQTMQLVDWIGLGADSVENDAKFKY